MYWQYRGGLDLPRYVRVCSRHVSYNALSRPISGSDYHSIVPVIYISISLIARGLWDFNCQLWVKNCALGNFRPSFKNLLNEDRTKKWICLSIKVLWCRKLRYISYESFLTWTEFVFFSILVGRMLAIRLPIKNEVECAMKSTPVI